MATKTKSRKASTTKTTKAPAKAKRAKQPVAPPVEQDEVRLMFGDDAHKAVGSPISHARRAIHEVLQAGPLSVEQLAEKLAAKYGISRSAINRQLEFEFNKRQTKKLTKDRRGRIKLVDGYSTPAFRHATE